MDEKLMVEQIWYIEMKDGNCELKW